jgi:hypothetical protein
MDFHRLAPSSEHYRITWNYFAALDTCSRGSQAVCKHFPEDNIKMDLQEVGWEGVAWIDMAQDRDRWRDLVNAVMNLRVP